ncbi:Mitochondrial import inner membrane translocase subunit tim13 [Yarrowia sp. C11]|nr:Mitochondrial import inner membrane translocase subunit tim13 [Yarrowia sp. E02]KAG5369370.1 Mitochondrial import inner membrane translocase subunit tim13 [Yarrowia sp. C11]
MSAALKDTIKKEIAGELAVANAQQLVTKMTENCFDMCVPKPGSSLSSAEKNCTAQCAQKYIMAWNLVSRVYITKLQQSGQR